MQPFARFAFVAAVAAAFLSACSDGGGSGSRCAAPLLRCGDVCVDPAHDPAHCGSCGVACDPGAFCVDGACAVACPEPLAACDDRCVDTTADPAHCGDCATACDAGEYCAAGTCTATCPEPLSVCGDRCVDTTADPAHCGGCDVACDRSQFCASGSCSARCFEGETLCGEACVDLAADPAHCGACGNACRADQACVDGACACADGEAECGGACVDLATDPSNCGGCGVACAGGLVCRSGGCAPPACTGDLLLPDLPSIEAGAFVTATALADLDGDGDLDIVAAIGPPETAVRWLENEAGRFGAPAFLADLPVTLDSLLVADLDGAGRLDLVGRPRFGGEGIGIVLLDAAGQARATTLAWPDAGIDDVALLDLDGDGDRDLAALGSTAGALREVRLAENDGAGAFAWHGPPIGTAERFGRVAAGDLNGDGKDDLAFYFHPGRLVVGLLRSEPFTFQPGPATPAGDQQRLQLADLDGDGDLDAVLDRGTLLANDGTGRFSPWDPAPAAATMSRVAAGDLDGDGDVDVVGLHPGRRVEILRNVEGAFPALETLHAAGGQSDVLLGDVDGDGTLDLVAGGSDERIDVLRNPGDGGFRSRRRHAEDLGIATSVVTGDLDGNGLDDAAVIPGSLARAFVFAGTPDGLLFAASMVTTHVFAGAAVGDLDGVGGPELLAVRSDTGQVYMVFGSMGMQRPIEDTGVARAVRVADADGDGWDDVVSIEGTPQPALRILYNRAFTAPELYHLVGDPLAFVAGDLDGDGDDDFAIATGGWLQVVRSDGFGRLETVAVLERSVTELALGDLDGDGAPELAVFAANTRRVEIFRFTGTALESLAQLEPAGNVEDLAIADLDADGFGDVVALCDGPGVVQVFPGRAGPPGEPRTWPALVEPSAPYGGQALAIADFDGDLRLDVVVVEEQGLSVLEGGCSE